MKGGGNAAYLIFSTFITHPGGIDVIFRREPANRVATIMGRIGGFEVPNSEEHSVVYISKKWGAGTVAVLCNCMVSRLIKLRIAPLPFCCFPSKFEPIC